MSEIQMAHFSFGGEPRDRSHFHAVAMREARSTTDRREGAAEAAPRRTVALRIPCEIFRDVVTMNSGCSQCRGLS